MNKDNLKVIRGGLLDSANTSRKVFISSYITDTRLMGVVGMYMHWQLPDNHLKKDFHQFFYFDAEEFSFDTYKSVLGDDQDAIDEVENSLIGGLGGKKVPLTLQEAKYTVQQYAEINEKFNLEFPDKRDEYQFLLDEPAILTEPEIYILMSKQCVSIESSYELINYFLMRCFGKDLGAAAFLSTQNFDVDLFRDFHAATFYKNNIKETDAPNVFHCDSLIEFNETYYIVITTVTLDGEYVSGLKRVSTMEITPAEAAMQLMRSEFISVYELDSTDKVNRSMSSLSKHAMITPHENGTLYMIFNPNNEHVCKQNYRLNEDVLGLYYVSNSNQFIAAAYSLTEMKTLENDLMCSNIAKSLTGISKYEFIEPVLYEFIQSGFDDFEIFVDAIKK